MTTLVRSETPEHNNVDALRARVLELEVTLGERGSEVTRVRSELHAFKTTYREKVGSLHEQLEKLELAIAEAELGELAKVIESRTNDTNQAPATERPVPLPRFTSDAVRKLFRDVAKIIHPDLARDELARDRRHSLMIEANRAYALGDEEQLRQILQAWERSPAAVEGTDPAAVRLRLERRAAEIEAELELLAAEMEALTASSVWKLKAMVDDAAAKGKDLVRETVTRLRRDIMAATNRLDAMRPPP